MNWDYFVQNRELAVACLITGLIFGMIMPMLWTIVRQVAESIGSGLKVCFANAYFVFMFFAFQIGLGIFLLQQWIFGYGVASGGQSFAYDQMAYMPLTVSIPLFFANIVAFICMTIRFGEIVGSDKNK